MREPGFYHVKYKRRWTIGEWRNKPNPYPSSESGYWTILGYTEWFANNELEKVDEERIKR